MLRDVAWREVKREWETEAQECFKLVVMNGLQDDYGKARCTDVFCKRCRRIVEKLKGGTAALRRLRLVCTYM